MGPLLEVGTGFHLELSGRENVYLNGAILGMRRAEIHRRFDEIVEFAGVEKFLDMPIKRYASGMMLRLAFSVAAHLEPDIVVVDEVLAVGDAEFQRRCLGKMSEFGREGRTVLFVSHDLGAIARICPRALWLEEGRIVHDGPAERSIELYLAARAERASYVELPPTPTRTSNSCRSAFASQEEHSSRHRAGTDLAVRARFRVSGPMRGLDVKIYLVTPRGVRVLDENLSDRDPESNVGEREGEWEAEARSSCSRRRRVRRRGRAAVAVPRVRRPRGAQLPRRPHARRHTGVGRANAAPAAGCRVDTPAALLVGRAASGDEEVHRQRHRGRSRGARPGGRGRARPRSGARSSAQSERRTRPAPNASGTRVRRRSSSRRQRRPRHDATPVLDDLDVVPAPKRAFSSGPV